MHVERQLAAGIDKLDGNRAEEWGGLRGNPGGNKNQRQHEEQGAGCKPNDTWRVIPSAARNPANRGVLATAAIDLSERSQKHPAPAHFARRALECADLSALWGGRRLVSAVGRGALILSRSSRHADKSAPPQSGVKPPQSKARGAKAFRERSRAVPGGEATRSRRDYRACRNGAVCILSSVHFCRLISKNIGVSDGISRIAIPLERASAVDVETGSDLVERRSFKTSDRVLLSA